MLSFTIVIVARFFKFPKKFKFIYFFILTWAKIHNNERKAGVMGTFSSKTFADNLQDLIAESRKPLNQLAKEIGISAGALSNYSNDSASAGMDAIVKIANYFCVSVDWLLGRSPTKSPNPTLQEVCIYTGLSEKAVDFFHNWTAPGLEVGPSYLSFLSQLIESAEFDIFINNLFQFFHAVAAKRILEGIPVDQQQRSIQMTIHKLARGDIYIKSPQLREKVEEYCEFRWNSSREAYTLDVSDAYEYHVTQALSALLRTVRDVAQVQAMGMLSDTLENILMLINNEKIGPEGENFINKRIKQVFQGLSF